AELEAVHDRHHEVEQDERGRLAADHLERLLAVRGRDDLVPLAPQDPRHLVARVGVVLDQQDVIARSAAHGTSAPRSFGRACGGRHPPDEGDSPAEAAEGARTESTEVLLLSAAPDRPVGLAERSSADSTDDVRSRFPARSRRSMAPPVIDPDYGGAPVPVREDLKEAHRFLLDHVRAPGAWWTGQERVSIAAASRGAPGRGLLHARKESLSPAAIAGRHRTGGELREDVVDAVHRIRTDPGRLSK